MYDTVIKNNNSKTVINFADYDIETGTKRVIT